MMKRRTFLNHTALAMAAYSLFTRNAGAEPSILMKKMLANSTERLLEWQPITQGPGFHWFSYYDIEQFDPTGRYVLGMQVDFEGRQPTPDDEVKIGIIDLHDDNRWQQIGTSKAWCWQQGCRLQWRPRSDREVLWNDREDGKLVCRILDVKSGALRTIPTPIDHIHPNGKVAIVADFARVGWMRPDYGYQGIADPNRKVQAPADSGIWKVNLDSGERSLLLSLADIAAFPSEGYSPAKKGFHYTNHLSWSPTGKSIMFLHRGDVAARMLIADADGKNIRFITNNPSHFTWKNDDTMLCWVPPAYRYYQTDGKGDSKGVSLFPAPNGHQTFIPGSDWLLTDTYPESDPGADRMQHIYLYHLKTGRKVIIGKFNSPKEYSGMWRCDTHPRLSPDFTKVTIDSPHLGGRQIYMVDISPILKGG